MENRAGEEFFQEINLDYYKFARKACDLPFRSSFTLIAQSNADTITRLPKTFWVTTSPEIQNFRMKLARQAMDLISEFDLGTVKNQEYQTSFISLYMQPIRFKLSPKILFLKCMLKEECTKAVWIKNSIPNTHFFLLLNFKQ